MSTAVVFDIQRMAVHDGPGLRTVVFMKGCPLRCPWCHNPESHAPQPELFVNQALCLGCFHLCEPACPHGAIRPGVEGLVVRQLCSGSGRCAEACPTEALRLSGRHMTPQEALDVVTRDRPFFEASGGGLTVSGGEPAWPRHAGFVQELLRLARAAGISTWVETCGAAPWRVYRSWLPYLDGMLFDLKLMDRRRHVQVTGASNAAIHRNVARLADVPGLALHIRMPLVPGYNDTPEELRALAAFVRTLAGPPPVEVLPYHTFGVGKYRLLGRPYPLDGLEPDPGSVERARGVLASAGLRVLRP